MIQRCRYVHLSRVGTQEGQRPPVAAALLPFEIPRSPLAQSLTSKDAADTPGIDTGFQSLLMRTPDKLGETALIEAVILFGEGEDDRGEPRRAISSKSR